MPYVTYISCGFSACPNKTAFTYCIRARQSDIQGKNCILGNDKRKHCLIRKPYADRCGLDGLFDERNLRNIRASLDSNIQSIHVFASSIHTQQACA